MNFRLGISSNGRMVIQHKPEVNDLSTTTLIYYYVRNLCVSEFRLQYVTTILTNY